MNRSTWLAPFALGFLALSFAPTTKASFITSVSVGGSGGTATTTIDNSDSSAPTVLYQATFTSIAPIDFTISLDGPGLFLVSFATPPDSVLNQTGQVITGLQFNLLNPPAGATLGFGQSRNNAPLPNSVFPGGLIYGLAGPPNLVPGERTSIGVGYRLAGTGPQTVTVRLTPFVASAAVPEPASLAMCGTAALAGLGYALRRRRMA